MADILVIQPSIPIPTHLTGEIQSKLAYVDESIVRAQVEVDRITIETRQPPGGELLEGMPAGAGSPDETWQRVLEEKVQRVVASMVGSLPKTQRAAQPKIQVLEDYLDRPVFYNLDPMTELLEQRQVSQEDTGIFALGPLLCSVIEYFEGQFLLLAEKFGALPYRFPTLIPARYLERVNYFRAFPQSLTFVTHLREDLDVIDAFSQTAACTDHVHLDAPPESFASIQALLSPAVCYHLYFSLADRPLAGGKLAATAVGNCFRYESINLSSLERLWNFTMREIIFVGPKEFVLENREEARKHMQAVFEALGLAYRVEGANDPFFIGEFRKQAAFQSAFQLKFEIRARLPYKNSTLAIGSYNYHQDFFGRNLNIPLSDGSPAHTGCVAFGLERVAFAFLAQYGLDKTLWPTVIREAVDEHNE